jgi:branched-chain amino acid transport system substrate-binding protein
MRRERVFIRPSKAVLRAALVTPLTGPLARYGQAGADALALWAEWWGGRSPQEVDLTVTDAHPDPVAALQLARRSAPDLLFGPYGSGPTAAVVAATDQLVWNHVGARVPPAGNVVSVLAPADTYFHGALRVVQCADPTVRTLSLVTGDSGFGRAVGDGAAAEARQLGFAVTRSSLVSDAGAAESAVQQMDTAMLLVAGQFTEELMGARRLLPRRWRAAGFVGAGVEEVLADLGAAREGLLGPAQWVGSVAPLPDEGPPAGQFVAAYRRRTGDDPPYPAAQAFAAGLVAGRCLQAAGVADDVALFAAARELRCTTLFAPFQIDPDTGQQIGHQVLTVQWQDGARAVVWPPERAQSALRHPLPRITPRT